MYLEKIPYKLSDLGQLNYAEALYILSQVLKGAEILYNRFGKKMILFDEEMIGFNIDGICKIWVC